jgi:hypothetical protein
MIGCWQCDLATSDFMAATCTDCFGDREISRHLIRNNEAMDRKTILLCLADFKRTRGSEFDLKSLGVFGSVARGDAGDRSDIDIVFGTANPNLLRTAALRNELESLLGKSVDIVRLRDHMNPRLKASIERDAVYV